MLRSYDDFLADRRSALRAGSRLIATRVGTVEFTEAGPGGRVPVLLFHGSPGGYDQTDLLAPVSAQEHRVIGWSRPGYLRTDLPVGPTFAEQADAAAALLDALGVAAAVPYGISGGGPAALEFARRHPARAAGLVLDSAVTRRYAPVISPLAGLVFLNGPGTRMAAAVARRHPRAALRALVRQESSLDRRGRRRVVERGMADRARREVVQTIMESLTPFEDRKAGLENDLVRFAALDDTLTDGVTCPTLVLHGSHDGDVHPSHARHAAQTIPTARLHLVPDGWHLLSLSAGSEAALAATGAFLREVCRRR